MRLLRLDVSVFPAASAGGEIADRVGPGGPPPAPRAR